MESPPRDIPELNVILAAWWRPVAGADSGGGGWLDSRMSPEG